MTDANVRDIFIPDNTDIFKHDRQRRLVSLIVPAYNEERNIARLEKELTECTANLPYDFEFIIIDNCSTDRTGNLIKEICRRDDRWKYIRFSRNFKVESSIAAGYHFASGDAMIVLYSDLQEPPQLIPSFLEQWEHGYDIVYGVHTARQGEAPLLSIVVHLAYRFVNWCSEAPIPEHSGDFRLISRRVRDALEQCGDYHRYTRGLIAWLGFPRIGIEYERRPRTEGKSNSDFSVYWSYFTNAITGFSLKPLRFFSLIAAISAAISLSVLAVGAFLLLQHHYLLGGFLLLAALQVGLASLQYFGIGMLGEYSGRTYTEVKHRPLYIVEESVNMPAAIHQPELSHAYTR